MKTSAFFIMGMLLFTSCEKLEPVKTGQYFKTEGVKVEVVSVNDSRCATGAMCITEGFVAVEFLATKGSESESFQLQLTGTSTGTDTLLMGYMFTLKAVTPFPDLSDSTTLDDAEKLVDLSIEKQ